MDVTKSNFIRVVDSVEALLPDADFISIDCEFTGLYTTVSNDYLDTFEEFYTKSRQNICQFQIVQIGLSIFKMVSKTEDEFDVNSFNFYIFPKECSLLEKQDKERYFLSQASSLAFLAENGFDFNKLIRDGISYLNFSQGKLVKERMAERKNTANNRTDRITNISDLDKAFLDDVMKQITDFASDPARTELVLPPGNAFKRRLIYEAVAFSEFNEQIDLACTSADKMKLTARKSSPEAKKDRERNALLHMIGFSEVIKLLVKYKKPLVGHNLYLDLLYIFNAFVEPLPENYKEFKSYFHSLFPIVYDTRFITAKSIIIALIGNSSLGNVYQTVQRDPFPQTTFNLKNRVEGENHNQHEAGYDSYITGVTFVNMMRYLYMQEFTPVEDMFNNVVLDAYRNKVGIFKTLDLSYMNLEADDKPLARKHVFHVTFPKEWKTLNISQLFSHPDIGGCQTVTYINDTSAFVVLKEPTNACKVVEHLILKPQPPSYKVQVYADFVKKNSSDKGKAGPSASTPKQEVTGGNINKIGSKKSRPNKSLEDQHQLSSSPPKSKKIKKDDELSPQLKKSSPASKSNGALKSNGSVANKGNDIKTTPETKTRFTRSSSRKMMANGEEKAAESLFSVPSWDEK